MLYARNLIQFVCYTLYTYRYIQGNDIENFKYLQSRIIRLTDHDVGNMTENVTYTSDGNSRNVIT